MVVFVMNITASLIGSAIVAAISTHHEKPYGFS